MTEFNIQRFGTLNSTNDKAKDFPPGSVIIAEEQTAGKGRFDRKWNSGKGGIYLSIVIDTQTDNAKLLTFIASIATQKALKKTHNIDSGIKWPNDLLLYNKKLCGILTETLITSDQTKMIIGIGINTNNTIPDELKDIAISLKDMDIKADNKDIIDELLSQFEELLEKDNEEVINEWKDLNCTLSKKIRVTTRGIEYDAIAKDIDEECNLIVERSNGNTTIIIEGDITIKEGKI